MNPTKDSHPLSIATLATLSLLAVALLLHGCASNASPWKNDASQPREKISLDEGWRFIKGDPSDAGNLSYNNLKPALLAAASSQDLVIRNTSGTNPGAHVSYVQPAYLDSSWRELDLPHDWGIEGPFSMSLPAGTGRLPWAGVAWYRKTLVIPTSLEGKCFFLDMDGAMAYPSVWVNGHYAGGWPYGYSSFQIDITPYVKPGAENTIAIRLDNPPNSSRWYPGGGIYRNIWLETTDPVHIAHWGTQVTTPQISNTTATVNVKVALANDSSAKANVSVRVQVYPLNSDGTISGRVVATSSPVSLEVAIHGNPTASLDLSMPNPKLWSPKTPNMYAAVTTVEQDGRIVDSTTTNFGIRTIKFDPDKGFFINGEHLAIQGVCDHHDLGPIGTANNTRALERQIQILQEMGCNAIRTSHNPPSPELLDLCDRMGMVVMDEAFDCWNQGKTRNDYQLLFPDWHVKDMTAFVRRDRNHPSVVLWSLGNEIPNANTAISVDIAHELAAIVHKEDPTRPTTIGATSTPMRGFQNEFDVFGFTYRIPLYVPFHQSNPTIPLNGSETASTISSRGVYIYPVSNNKLDGAAPDHQMSSYDLFAPAWATLPDEEFAVLDQNPWVGGEFVWTGFDYLGEPTNNGARGTPDASRSSYFGIIDLDGFKKDRFYLYQSRWRPDLPMAHILPHWNWAGFEGEVTPVMVYTSGDSAELFLNGKSLGKKTKGSNEYRLRWDDVLYQPGELHVVAYKDGKKWAEDTMKTTGPAAKLATTPDRATIRNDGKDLSYVTVSVRDKDGLIVPDTHNPLRYSITGPGEIIAADNGDATSLDPIWHATQGKIFNGLALVIVRAKPGQSGSITITAESDGLASTTATINSSAGR